MSSPVHFLHLLLRFETLFLFFSVIGAGVSHLRWGIRALNCRDFNSVMKIHPWISENWCNFIEFIDGVWFWKLGFVNCSWWFFCFDPNCQERESFTCLWVGTDWMGLCGFLWHCALFISCHLYLRSNEMVTPGLVWLGLGLVVT